MRAAVILRDPTVDGGCWGGRLAFVTYYLVLCRTRYASKKVRYFTDVGK